MANSEIRDLEQETTREEIPPPPKQGDVAEKGEVVLTGREDVIRSVYVARTASPSSAAAGDFATMATAEEGLSVRGAYMAHLSQTQAETAGEHDPLGGNVLRQAYVVRTVAEPAPKRTASAGRKAAARPKAKKLAAARAKSKPKAQRKGRGRARAGKRARR